MKITTTWSIPAVICTAIIAVTAAVKAWSLLSGAPLQSNEHPWLPGTFRTWMIAALVAELITLAFWRFGRLAFLRASFWLSLVFVGYHAAQKILGVRSPCGCLGGAIFPHHSEAESIVSLAMAFVLLAVSLFSSFTASISQVEVPKAASRSIWASSAGVLLWGLAGGLVVKWWSGLVLGGDEGMELSKAMLAYKRPEQVPLMWNDQPFLFSGYLATLFGWFGSTLEVARAGVIALGALIPIAIGVALRPYCLSWAAVPAVAFIWFASANVVGAAMMESAAYALGLASLIPLVISPNRWGIAGSAVIAALAMSTKATAAFALVVPATILVMQHGIRIGVVWGLGVVGLAVIGLSIQPGWSWSHSIASHTASPDVNAYRFDGGFAVASWFLVGAAVVGAVHRYFRNDLAPLFPWIFSLLVALIIHSAHRPYWDYYDLHFIVPLAVMASVCLFDVMKLAKTSPAFAMAAVASLVLGGAWFWQQFEFWRIHNSSGTIVTDGSPVIAEATKFAKIDPSAWSYDGQYAFAAGLVQTPPEFTIIPRKRFWSGQLNPHYMAQTIVSNQVAQIILPTYIFTDTNWVGLRDKYSAAAYAQHQVLFVRKDILGSDVIDPLNPTDALKALGF